MKTRNHAFDLLCGLCILRMIALHVMSFCGHASDPWWGGVMRWSFFFMSFFFFKAGYFNKSTTLPSPSGNPLANTPSGNGPSPSPSADISPSISPSPSARYVADRVRRLLVPYVSWAIIGDVIYFAFLPLMISLYRKPIEPITVSMLWQRGQAYGNGPLWFLMSFFTAYIIAHLLDKLPRPLPRCVLVVLFPYVSYLFFRLGNPLWLGLDNVFIGVYFFYLGRWWHRLCEWMGRRLMMELSTVLCLVFVVGNVVWHAEQTMSSNTFTGNPLLATLNISCVLCGLSGLLIGLRVPRVPLVSFIGEHSMVYFVAHYPMLYLYKFTHLAFHRSIFGRYDDALLLFPILLGLCSWLVPYVERVPWLSGRFGQGRRKRGEGGQVSEGLLQ